MTKAAIANLRRIERECAAGQLRLINRAITGLYDEALRPLELKVGQMSLLVLASNRDVVRPADICCGLQMDPSTLSRNVERMRAKGWLEVVPGGDARARPFRLTPKGKRLLQRAVPVWEKAQRDAHALLGDRGASSLRRIAARICSQTR